MAFSAGLIVQNWSTGATTRGGAFNPTSANFATDLTTDSNTGNTASPVVSSASYNFAAGDVGAWIFIQGGTNWTAGWYQVASVASNKATLTAGVGAAVLYGTVATGTNYQRPNGLNTAAGVATVGTPTGGIWSVDYSQQIGAGITYTDAASAGAGSTYTSTLNPVGVNIVGNVVNVTGGTNFTTGRYEVISVSGTTATVDRAITTGVGALGAGELGGAVGSSAALTALTFSLVAGNYVAVKATGTYTLTTTTTIPSTVKGDLTSGKIKVEGYTTFMGQRDGRPVITSATNSVHLITLNDNDYVDFIHLKFTHTAATRGAAFTNVTVVAAPITIADCVVDGCSTLFNAMLTSHTIYLRRVEIMNTTSTTAAIIGGAGNTGTVFINGCDIHDNAGDGIRPNTGGTVNTVNCQDTIFDTNAIGINFTGGGATVSLTCHGCIFVDHTSDGIKIAATSSTVSLEFENNVFYGNGGYGIDNLDEQAAADASMRINRNNAYGANNGGGTGLDLLGLAHGRGDIALTADPFTSRSGRDFTPNNTAGGGALLRSAGFPGAFPGGTTTDHKDVGIQHADSGGGASPRFGAAGCGPSFRGAA